MANPGGAHESPIEVVSVEPQLAADLVAELGGVTVPDGARVTSRSETVRKMVSSYRSDARLLWENEDGKPLLAIIWESQNGYDTTKKYTWPLYVAHSDIDDKVDTILLVYCPTRALADWCRRLMSDRAGSMRLRLITVCPDDVPLVTDVHLARAAPARTVFAALCHGEDLDEETMFPLLAEALKAAGAKGRNYDDALKVGLPAQRALNWEAFVQTTLRGYRSEFYRGAVAEGVAEGEARGEARGEAKALLVFLEARGLSISDDARETIQSCTDVDQLDTWLRNAATVDTVEQLLAR